MGHVEDEVRQVGERPTPMRCEKHEMYYSDTCFACALDVDPSSIEAGFVLEERVLRVQIPSLLKAENWSDLADLATRLKFVAWKKAFVKEKR